MTSRDGLRGLLDSWAEATGCAYALKDYAEPRSYRTAGEWWKDGSGWCLHLSAEQYAAFSSELDEVARNTLSWSLQTLSEQQSAAGSAVLHYLSQLLRQAELAGMAGPAQPFEMHSTEADAFRDGRFIVVDPHTGSGRHAVRDEDLREVIDAVFPDAFIGLVEQPGRAPMLLLYARNHDLFDSASESGTNASARPPLRQRLTEFADVLEEDAMVASTMFVSRSVQTPVDVPDALLTIALMARHRHRLSAPRHLYIWGEYPVQVLLAGLSGKVVCWFREAVDSVHDAPHASADIRETLFGLMAANLNVSEAARHLYIHRNTLLNRLERIRELNGYDLRDFHDALVMWLRLMLSDTASTTDADSEGDVPISHPH